MTIDCVGQYLDLTALVCNLLLLLLLNATTCTVLERNVYFVAVKKRCGGGTICPFKGYNPVLSSHSNIHCILVRISHLSAHDWRM